MRCLARIILCFVPILYRLSTILVPKLVHTKRLRLLPRPRTNQKAGTCRLFSWKNIGVYSDALEAWEAVQRISETNV